MEVGVRLVGIILRLLNALFAPLFWLRAQGRKERVRTLPQPLLMRSAKDLAAAIRSGEITSEHLVLAYIDRVREVNPLLNAVVDERFRGALDDAKCVDRQIAEARAAGTHDELFRSKPLLGVPFSVKESCSLGGLSNSVGCVENAGSKATADGAAVRLVRQCGAIPLLVSNTPELCLGWETTNLLRGATNNPYCLTRTPGGSSGGEGALLACGAAAFGVASDIAGSVRVPAAFCGLFGHKPTPGIIPIEGHIPTLSDARFSRLLTVGPMCRWADDLALLTACMAGPDRHKLRLDEPVDLSTLKVLYMTEASSSLALLGVHRSIQETIENAANYLHHDCGAQLSQEKFKDLEDSVEISISVFFSMKDIPNMLLDPADPKVERSLILELIKYAFGGGTRSLQGLCFTMINKTNLFIPESRREYYSNKAKKLGEEMKRVLGDNGVLLYPVFNDLAHHHNQVYLRGSGVLYTMVFNVLGMPATAVPMGLHNGLPVGIQVVAAPGQDRLCLAVARCLERGFGGWRPPSSPGTHTTTTTAAS